jgi:chemotaxis protein methyltransferase CheR
MPALSASEYERVRRLVHATVGIELGPAKQSLVEARLAKRMRELDLPSHGDYLARIEDDPDGDEMALLLDAISTNVTSFFRERAGLDAIAALHAEAVRGGQRRLRYWSAASSSGEEPYSLAMLLAEAAPLPGLDLAILGTDISSRVIARARAARYGPQAVAGIPADLRRRYLQSAGDLEEIDPSLRSLVTINRLNLIRPPFPMRGPFDAVLCRNVMIYFDLPTRARLLAEIARLLRPGGLLVTGQAESLAGHTPGFEVVKPSIYKRTR